LPIIALARYGIKNVIPIWIWKWYNSRFVYIYLCFLRIGADVNYPIVNGLLLAYSWLERLNVNSRCFFLIKWWQKSLF